MIHVHTKTFVHAQVRRRVAALREVQAKQDEVTKAFVRERAEIEAKFAQQLGE